VILNNSLPIFLHNKFLPNQRRESSCKGSQIFDTNGTSFIQSRIFSHFFVFTHLGELVDEASVVNDPNHLVPHTHDQIQTN
jgi:hypothetical protein